MSSVSRVQFASKMNFSTLFLSEMEHVILNSYTEFVSGPKYRPRESYKFDIVKIGIGFIDQFNLDKLNA